MRLFLPLPTMHKKPLKPCLYDPKNPPRSPPQGVFTPLFLPAPPSHLLPPRQRSSPGFPPTHGDRISCRPPDSHPLSFSFSNTPPLLLHLKRYIHPPSPLLIPLLKGGPPTPNRGLIKRGPQGEGWRGEKRGGRKTGKRGRGGGKTSAICSISLERDWWEEWVKERDGEGRRNKFFM